MLFIQQIFRLVRRHRNVDGAHGFVRVLRVLFRGIKIRLFGRVIIAVRGADVCQRALLRFRRNTYGVRSHIRDERDMVAVFRADAFVQVLREAHRFGRREAQLVGRFLLHRRSGERRGRVAFHHRFFHRSHNEFSRFQRGEHRFRFLFGSGLVFLAVFLFEGSFERRVFQFLILQQRGNVPVFLRLERFDFPFSVHNQFQRHRLHSAARKRSGIVFRFDFVVQQGGKFVAHQSVQHAARLLRVHKVIIDCPRLRKRFFHRFLRNFVEFDAVFRFFV